MTTKRSLELKDSCKTISHVAFFQKSRLCSCRI